MSAQTDDIQTSDRASSSLSDSLPDVRTISIADIRVALNKGLDDFRETRTYIIFLSAIYAIVGLLMIRFSFDYGMIELVFPLLSGFALVGPLSAIGLYELSRRREAGLNAHWRHMFGVLRSASLAGIIAIGCILLLCFTAWIVIAEQLYLSTIGTLGENGQGFVQNLFGTWQGWVMIIVGNAIGAIFAVVVMTISVVSLPMLVDRHVGFLTAIATSVRAVKKNPVPLFAWGMAVGTGLMLGAIPFLIGLAIVLPIFGHATWHLYTMLVQR